MGVNFGGYTSVNDKQAGQVPLSKLLFTQSWEDPESDIQALRIQNQDALMCVTSGACNVLGFLLHDPLVVYAVDINPCQSYLLELKMAAIKRLDHSQLLEFLGVRESRTRLLTLDTLLPEMSAQARSFWISQAPLIKLGILGQGRYERFIALVRALFKLVQGSNLVNDLFLFKDLNQQVDFFNKNWDTWRWKLVFKVLLNKYTLARLGLSKDYFHFDDGSQSFSESFYRRCRRAMTEIPIQGNYFLSLYFLGHYANERELPEYLLPENIQTIRARLDRIKIVTQDAQTWMTSLPENSIDCFSLSNICELMDDKATLATFNELARTGKPGARVCFRNLMIPRAVPEVLTSRVQQNQELSANLLANDRSFVYSRVDALRIVK